jgi:hypothetical protein
MDERVQCPMCGSMVPDVIYDDCAAVDLAAVVSILDVLPGPSTLQLESSAIACSTDGQDPHTPTE